MVVIKLLSKAFTDLGQKQASSIKRKPGREGWSHKNKWVKRTVCIQKQSREQKTKCDFHIDSYLRVEQPFVNYRFCIT